MILDFDFKLIVEPAMTDTAIGIKSVGLCIRCICTTIRTFIQFCKYRTILIVNSSNRVLTCRTLRTAQLCDIHGLHCQLLESRCRRIIVGYSIQVNSMIACSSYHCLHLIFTIRQIFNCLISIIQKIAVGRMPAVKVASVWISIDLLS